MRFLLAMMMLVAVSACMADPPKPACIIQIDNATWQLEIATTDQEREKGLMFRSYMPEENGMIFVFPAPHEVTMWMKNTYIPLDMLFVDKNFAIIGEQEGAAPLSEDIIQSPKETAYVLELNSGQIKEHQLKIRDQLDMSQCPVLAIKK